MAKNNFRISFFIFVLCVPVLISISTAASNSSSALSWDHITVWFDYQVRYYDHEAENAYSKKDLAIMVDVVSSRFNKIIIGAAPPQEKLPPSPEANSRVWIPSVVAEHNKEKGSSGKPMEVIVTYDVAKVVRTAEVTSFDTALYMADTSNQISPGTVKTLMMYTGFSVFASLYNAKDLVQQLKVAREKINSNASLVNGADAQFKRHNYSLAVFMDLKDCGHFRGTLGEKAKELLPHVEIISLLLRPSYHSMSFNPEVTHKMFITKFEDCEKKLKKEKSDIQLIPAVLWMSRSKKEVVSSMVQGWQLMSNWAKKNNRNVIMYEAFDTPNGHLISDQGWWKLRDRSEHVISKSAFVEKIQEMGSTSSKSDSSPYSPEDISDEESESSSSGSGKTISDKKLFRMSSALQSSEAPSAVYIALILLSVICTLLVAVIAGLIYGFNSIVLNKNNNSIIQNSNNHRHHHSFEDDNDGNMNGSVLEVRDNDTTPIVAVTYKK